MDTGIGDAVIAQRTPNFVELTGAGWLVRAVPQRTFRFEGPFGCVFAAGPAGKQCTHFLAGCCSFQHFVLATEVRKVMVYPL